MLVHLSIISNQQRVAVAARKNKPEQGITQRKRALMNFILVTLAEIWRVRVKIGVPVVVFALLAAIYSLQVPPTFEATALLQVQSDQAKSPLLQNISAPGQGEALRQILVNPQLLADTGTDAQRKLQADKVSLRVINNNLMTISYRSHAPEGLEQMTDALAYNFIQALLAPERMRLEQMILQNQQELKEIVGRLATSDGADEATRLELNARSEKLQGDTVQLQSDLRRVNLAFGRHGSQALVWFAETATMNEPLQGTARVVANMILAGLLGGLLFGLLQKLPFANRAVVESEDDAAAASDMQVVGTLPWLGKLNVTPRGLHVMAGGKKLRPSEFSELGRLQRSLVRNLRGPLVLLGAKGGEGSSTLALLLAERTAEQGKTVILVDMNLRDRMLSQWLGLGDGNWELPKGAKAKKGGWEALQPMPGSDNLKLLAAPRHPETLSKLGEAGGLPVLFDMLTEMADVVIVDGSPLAAVNRGNVDAVAVASASARTLLLAQASVTTQSELKRATDSLLLVGAPLLGVVLNMQFMLSRRQLLGQLADRLGKVLPPLAKALRKATLKAKLD